MSVIFSCASGPRPCSRFRTRPLLRFDPTRPASPVLSARLPPTLSSPPGPRVDATGGAGGCTVGVYASPLPPPIAPRHVVTRAPSGPGPLVAPAGGPGPGRRGRGAARGACLAWTRKTSKPSALRPRRRVVVGPPAGLAVRPWTAAVAVAVELACPPSPTRGEVPSRPRVGRGGRDGTGRASKTRRSEVRRSIMPDSAEVAHRFPRHRVLSLGRPPPLGLRSGGDRGAEDTGTRSVKGRRTKRVNESLANQTGGRPRSGRGRRTGPRTRGPVRPLLRPGVPQPRFRLHTF